MFGHKIEDSDFLAKVTYTDEEIVFILSQEIDSSVMQEKSKKKRSSNKRQDREAILKNDPHYNDPQVVTLLVKSKRSAKCSGHNCRKIFQIGDTCLMVDGCISIPYEQNLAKKQQQWFCPSVSCLKKPPVWTNIRFPLEIKKGDLVSDVVYDTLNNDLQQSSMA